MNARRADLRRLDSLRNRVLVTSQRAAGAAERHLVRRGFEAMGTAVSFAVLTDDDEGAERAIAAAFDEITAHRGSDDHVADDSRGVAHQRRRRHRAGQGRPRDARSDRDGAARPRRCRAASSTSRSTRCTGCGSSTRIWRRRSRPADAIRSGCNARRLSQDHRRPRPSRPCSSTKKGMGISLGGIAKGYAVDRAVAVLRRAGFSDAIVQAGGDLMCAGSKNGAPWVDRDSRSARRAQRRVRQDDADQPRVLDGGRLRALLHPRRQALPPHHRSTHRLSGDAVALGDHLRPERAHRRRASTTRSSSSAGRRASR